jgi:serine protease Do
MSNACRLSRCLTAVVAAIAAAIGCLYSSGGVCAAENLGELEQQAFDAAAESVAECVVQIRTVGGLDQVDGQRLAQGPTTGLIVTSDGYIVSSAINFAQRPSSILVRLPDGDQQPAELIGRDDNRMLVLLKVSAERPLPTPEAAPLSQLRVGDWAVALGRTYDAGRVNLSVGVVSALGRMQGRAVQTDANASAANYGGPLVDLYGRVIGILVPMSPQSASPGEVDELAGVEYYDSGIAFAVPLEHVLSVLDRWIEVGDLKRGLLGVGMTDGNPHTSEPRVTAVWPGSPASVAKWKPDDLIVSVDGKPVQTQMQMRFALAPRYAGDAFSVILRRGQGDDAEDVETRVTLAAELPAHRHAFLGILPERSGPPANEAADDAESAEERGAKATGVAIRAVWPKSPAADAGLQAGDLITKLGDHEIETPSDAYDAIGSRHPGDDVAIKVQRREEELELNATLAEISDKLPEFDGPPQPEATADEDAVELEEFKLPELPQTARFYAPAKNGTPPGLLIWLATGDAAKDGEFAAQWAGICRRDGLVLLLAAPADAKGWTSDDMEFLGRLIPAAMRRFGADERRIVVAGEGKGGQLAYAVGFQARRWVRGIAVVDSPLPRTLKLPPNGPGDPLAVLSIESEDAPLAQLIRQDLDKIRDTGRPVTQVIVEKSRRENGGLDLAAQTTLTAWIDALDRF